MLNKNYPLYIQNFCSFGMVSIATQLEKIPKFMAFQEVILYTVQAFLSPKYTLIVDIYPVVTL